MQSNSVVQDSEEKIKKSLEEYETKAKEDYDSKLKIQTSMIISKNNQDITKDTLKIKQEIEKRRLELVDSLFDDLEKKLIGFKKSEEYKELLVKQIKDIKDYAKDSRITIYIDETDASLVKYLEDNVYSEVTLDDICNTFFVRKSRLSVVFKQHTGKSPMHYFKNLKTEEAKKLLREETLPVSRICEMLGYSGIHNFTRSFKAATGFSPTGYRKSVLLLLS